MNERAIAQLRTRVKWNDLVPVTRLEVIKELGLPLPWLVGTIFFSANELYTLALPCTFFLFLTLLRVAHNAYHNAVGTGRRVTDILLLMMSGLMMVPLHAVKITHLSHHKHMMGEGDLEGHAGRKPLWHVLLYGPRFPVDIVRAAWREGGGVIRGWIAAELALMIVLIFAAFVTGWAWLEYHVVIMLAGECFTALFAVWTVHHHMEDAAYAARTQRGKWKNRLSYFMFLHAEHHLFPAVPTCHLERLAERMDIAAPGLLRAQVI